MKDLQTTDFLWFSFLSHIRFPRSLKSITIYPLFSAKKTDGPMFLSLAALFRYGLFADRKGSEKQR